MRFPGVRNLEVRNDRFRRRTMDRNPAEPADDDGVWYSYYAFPSRKDGPVHIPPLPEFVPWSAARFHTEEARDRFVSVVQTQPPSEVEVTPMPNESRAALVRWRPRHFLGLNDIAYAHGGRINITSSRRGRGNDQP